MSQVALWSYPGIISLCLFVFEVVEDDVSAGGYRSVSERSDFKGARFVDVKVADAEEIPLIVCRVLSLYLE